MKYKTLRIIGLLVGVSLIGSVLSQVIWLQKSVATSQVQFDHRADQMLGDVLDELKEFADTSQFIVQRDQDGNLEVFDVIDTLLLADLVEKYSKYHRLDSVHSYAIVSSISGAIIHQSSYFTIEQEELAYKACLSCIWKKEYLHLSVSYPDSKKMALAGLLGWISLSSVFILVIAGAFIYIIVNIYKQKKIDEIRTDFVNNMTHEFKTPISTISLASEILKNADAKTSAPRIRKYAKVIYDENQRMRSQVEQVLNIATIDRGLVNINPQDVNFHDLIYSSVESFCLEECEKEVKIDYALNANKSILKLDKLHVRNVINNLVDNAIKYSGLNPKILIATENQNGNLVFSIKDNGIGIPKESLGKIFDKFYRVSTGDVHDVKGFGLGLYYVKTMVSAHNGNVEVDSLQNEGTTIRLYFKQH